MSFGMVCFLIGAFNVSPHTTSGTSQNAPYLCRRGLEELHPIAVGVFYHGNGDPWANSDGRYGHVVASGGTTIGNFLQIGDIHREIAVSKSASNATLRRTSKIPGA